MKTLSNITLSISNPVFIVSFLNKSRHVASQRVHTNSSVSVMYYAFKCGQQRQPNDFTSWLSSLDDSATVRVCAFTLAIILGDIWIILTTDSFLRFLCLSRLCSVNVACDENENLYIKSNE